MANEYILSKQVRMIDNTVIDLPLRRKTVLTASPGELKALSEEYYLNLKRPLGSMFTNTPYRTDIDGMGCFGIFWSVYLVLFRLFTIPIIIVSAILLVSTENLLLSCSVFANLAGLLLPLAVHETLHMFCFRRITGCKDGTLIVKGVMVFTLFPEYRLSPVEQMMFSATPSLLCIAVGLLLLLTGIAIGNSFLTPIFVCLAAPWVCQIINFLPFTSDCQAVIKAIRSWNKRQDE